MEIFQLCWMTDSLFIKSTEKYYSYINEKLRSFDGKLVSFSCQAFIYQEHLFTVFLQLLSCMHKKTYSIINMYLFKNNDRLTVETPCREYMSGLYIYCENPHQWCLTCGQKWKTLKKYTLPSSPFSVIKSGSQFYWWSKLEHLEKTADLLQVTPWLTKIFSIDSHYKDNVNAAAIM